MSTEPKRGTKGETMSKRERFGTCDMLNIPHPQGHAGCANWREVESAPAQPCKKCGKPKFGPWSTICSADIGKVNEYYCQCVEVFESVPPAAPEQPPVEPCCYGMCVAGNQHSDDCTAMTAEQFDENWLRSRHFFVTGCNKGALVTLDDALAYSAHVREAAQEGAMQKGPMKDNEVELPPTFGQTGTAGDVEGMLTVVGLQRALEASDRKLAESESGLNQLLFALGCQLGGVNSALQVIEAKNAHIETAESQLAELDKALQSALFPLAVLVQSGECVAAATALNEELKLQILTAHDDVYAALASLRAESKEG